MDGHMDASLVHQSHGGGLSWLNQGTTGYKPYHYVKGEARNYCRLDETCILYNYKVIKQPSDAVYGHMDASLLHQSRAGGLILLNLGNNCVQIIPTLHIQGQELLQTELYLYLINIKFLSTF